MEYLVAEVAFLWGRCFFVWECEGFEIRESSSFIQLSVCSQKMGEIFIRFKYFIYSVLKRFYWVVGLILSYVLCEKFGRVGKSLYLCTRKRETGVSGRLGFGDLFCVCLLGFLLFG